MPLYNFKCKACDERTQFAIDIKDAPRVGASAPVIPELVGDAVDCSCGNCGANNWTRVWPSKTGGFKMSMRRTPVL